MATVTVHRGPATESGLAQRLRREIEGEVLFDAFSRGRYSTDASIYQVEPLGVVIPKTSQGIAAAIAIAQEEGVPVLPRGGGTSRWAPTNVTRAPRLMAASARATPCLPLDRLPMKRTGSRGSRVPPAETRMLTPSRSRTTLLSACT